MFGYSNFGNNTIPSYLIPSAQFDPKELKQVEKEIKKNPSIEIAVDNYKGYISQVLDTGSSSFFERNKIVNEKGFYEIERIVETNHQVIACENLLTRSVTQMDIKVKAPNRNESAKLLADFWNYNFKFMDGTINRAVEQLLKTGRIYGYSLSEKNYRFSDVDKRFSDKLLIKNIKHKKSGAFEFVLDYFGNILAVKSLHDFKNLPAEKFIIYSYDAKYSNPYGNGVAEPLYYLCFLMRELMKHMAIAADRWASPTLVMKILNGYDDTVLLNKAQNIIRSVKSSSGITVPEGMEASLLEASKANGNPFINILTFIENAIAKIILGNSASVNENLKGNGSRADSKTKMEVTEININYLIQDAKDLIFEQLIKPLTAFNFDSSSFPVTDYPELEIQPISNEDKTEQIKRFQMLFDMGAISMQDEGDRAKVRSVDGFAIEDQTIQDESVIDDSKDIEKKDITDPEGEDEENISTSMP